MKELIGLLGFALVSIASAETVTHGDWYWSSDSLNDGFIYSASTNDDGHILGQYCYFESDNCFYILAFDTSCEKGSAGYIGIANSELDARNVEFECLGILEGRLYGYIFKDFESIQEVVLQANKVGIAFPLQEDRFKVIRFSLIGSNEAIDGMLNFYRERNSARKSAGTSSQIL